MYIFEFIVIYFRKKGEIVGSGYSLILSAFKVYIDLIGKFTVIGGVSILCFMLGSFVFSVVFNNLTRIGGAVKRSYRSGVSSRFSSKLSNYYRTGAQTNKDMSKNYSSRT